MPRSRPWRSVAALTAAVLATSAAVVLPTTAANAAPPFPIDDPFAGLPVGTTMPSGWQRIASNDAQAAIVDNGAAGKWLRLTSDSEREFGAVYNTVPYSAEAGLSVEFDMRMFDSTDNGYADGMSFFLQDASVTLDRVGPVGGALGYQNHEFSCDEGLPGGVIGLGFDRYGNFQSPQKPNAIALRGPATDCYQVLASTSDKGNGFLESRGKSAAEAGYHRVRLDILPTSGADARVIASMSPLTALGAEPSEVKQYLDTTIPKTDLPDKVRLGFAGSTGGLRQYHEVRGIRASQPADLSTSARAVGDTTGLLPGDRIEYEITTANDGPAEIGGAPDAFARTAAHLDELHVDDVHWTCTAHDGATCLHTEGDDAVAVDWKGPSGSGITIRVSGRVASDAPAGTFTTDAAAVTDFVSNRLELGSNAVVADGSVNDVDLDDNASPLHIGIRLEDPTAADDTGSTVQGVGVDVDVLANDTVDRTGVDPTTLVLTDRGLSGAALEDGGRRLVVPGEGTWTVGNGVLHFEPLPTFIGAATRVVYEVSSNGGQTASASVTVTVTPGAVTALDDSATTGQAEPVEVSVLDNDTPDPSGFDEDTLTLTAPKGGGKRAGDDVAVAGEGTWTVRDGAVRFVPEDTFIGTTTPVRYRVATMAGQAASASVTVTVTPGAVAAVDDSASTGQAEPVEVAVLDNDTPDPSGFETDSLRLEGSDGDGHVVVPGQGTFSIVSGEVAFAPVPTFIGTTQGVRYEVATRAGQHVGATLTVAVDAAPVSAADDHATTDQAEPVVIDVLRNDTADPSGFDETTVVFAAAAPGTVSEQGKRLAVPDQGTWTVQADGSLRFEPLPTMIGTTAAVPYEVATHAAQRVSATATVEVTAAPVAGHDDDASTVQAEPVDVDVLRNDEADPSGFDPASVRLVDADRDGHVVIDGEGTWSVTADGTLRFEPVATFIGTSAPVEYEALTAAGQPVRASVRIQVTPAPFSVRDDTATIEQGAASSVDVLANDEADPSGFDVDSLVLERPSGLDAELSDDHRVLRVPGEATYRVERGSVQVEPDVLLIGTATPIGYSVRTEAGQQASATLTVTTTAAPTSASPDEAATDQAEAVEVDVLENDAPDPSGFDRSSVRIEPDGQGAGQHEVDVPGQGRWSTTHHGLVRFEPEATFLGVATAGYSVRTEAGQTVRSEVRVDVRALPIEVSGDSAVTTQALPVTVDVLTNDVADPSGWDVGTLGLVAEDRTGDVGSGTLVTETTTSAGRFAIEDGAIVFTPSPAFVGRATVTYSVATAAGQRGDAELEVDVRGVGPRAADDTVRTRYETPVTLDPLANDHPGVDGGSALVPGSLRLLDADGLEQRRIERPEGTFAVLSGGAVRFDPAPGFSGSVPGVRYRVVDTAGAPGEADVHVTVDQEELAFTGAELAGAAALSVLLAAAGVVLLVGRRLRRRGPAGPRRS